jgi:hypothetical protein
MQQDLSPGTHLITRRRGYVHHGLYAGDGRVIHYAGFSRWFRRGPVEEVSLNQFAAGRGWQVKQWATPRFAGPAAVERARGRLGENRYRLWSNNCEHLVEWCLNGTPRSAQVEALTSRVRFSFTALGSLLNSRQPAQSH